MTKGKFMQYFEEILGTTLYRGRFWKQHRDKLQGMFPFGTSADFIVKEFNKMNDCVATSYPCCPPVLVSNPPCYSKLDCPTPWPFGAKPIEQGNNPMKMNTVSTDLTINTTPGPSDAMKQREFLLSELNARSRYSWKDPVLKALAEKFHLNAPTIPASSQEIIDAFKNGDVTIDQKKVDNQTKWLAARAKDEDFDDDDYDTEDSNGTYIGSRYYGVTFTKLPKSDRPGYNAAVKEYEALKTDTERKINIFSPEAGLEALVAFEAWLPTAADTKH